MRVIMLADMDYFFAACEEARNRALSEVPLVIGSDEKMQNGRGVVMTCNYKARAFGIHSGMALSNAYRIKPDAVFMKMDYPYYERVSAEIMVTLRSYAENFEQVSIDEAYLDVSSIIKAEDSAAQYAREIASAIKAKTALSCSIGISNNKLLAKMACEEAKPAGICTVWEKDAKIFLKDLPIGKLYGVGKMTEQKLKAAGYDTIGKFASISPSSAERLLGSYGLVTLQYANGIDPEEVSESTEIKSIGRERTFDFDTSDIDLISETIRKLSSEVADEIKKQGLSFSTVTIKLRYFDFSDAFRSKTIRRSSSEETISKVALEIMLHSLDSSKKLRKVGVRVSSLSKNASRSLSQYIK